MLFGKLVVQYAVKLAMLSALLFAGGFGKGLF